MLTWAIENRQDSNTRLTKLRGSGHSFKLTLVKGLGFRPSDLELDTMMLNTQKLDKPQSNGIAHGLGLAPQLDLKGLRTTSRS